MTKTSKAIRFSLVKGAKTTTRRNAETGVEIVAQRIAGVRGMRYMVTAPTVDGFDVIDDEMDIENAKWTANERVELMREVIAEDYDEAIKLMTAELDELARGYGNTGMASRVIHTLIHATRCSLEAGFGGAAARRLNTLRAYLSGAMSFPTDEDIDRERTEARQRVPMGTLIRVGGEVARTEGEVNVEAETGRLFVMYRTTTKKVGDRYVKGGYGIAYLSDIEIV